ncbi:MAG TPA: hypothetical protein VFS45_04530, partial [Sphingomicrobium sp.]|nr:hypothetical protein [Sphingomicrobium sp.]
MAFATMLIPAVGATAASAQSVVPGAMVQSASLPSAGAVTAFYNTYRSAPMWFRGGTASPAAGRLVSILKRAQFDGLASGPQLASQVEAAIARAATGAPADVMAAEQMLSAAWVMYVQTLKRPTPRMIYAYSVLSPQNSRPDQILLTAAAAPSLEAHLQAVSSVNPTYAQIRESAWLQAQAAGTGPE